MSKHKWAALVYGRSYHLDFRFIAIPEDFSHQEIDWVSPYILATTRKARKLPSHPRWSLFKNDSHCVVGVTCMVRDLIGQLEDEEFELLTKDNRGRPLYVFLGYVTKLEKTKYLLDLPPYSGNNLERFKPLYSYVEQVWSVKDYNKDSKKPLSTDYQNVAFSTEKLAAGFKVDLVEQLNYPGKSPDKVFLWQNSPEQNHNLWATSASFHEQISICLDANHRRYSHSPFLNQTISQSEEFTTQERIINHVQPNEKRSLSESIGNKVREDIEITLQHASQVVSLGQELIDNFADWSNEADKTSLNSQETDSIKDENFGFKTKKSAKSQDWF